MIEIFTTNLYDPIEAKKITKILIRQFSELKINFDLERNSTLAYPCKHNVMRVEGSIIEQEEIITLMNKAGFKCDILQDIICK